MRPPTDPPTDRPPHTPPGLRLVLVVALGGGLGALLRHGVDVAAPVPDLSFPWPTLLVNITGSGALAAVGAVWTVQRRPALRSFLGPGLLGGWTTLSTYAEQGRRLLDADRTGVALAYLLGTLGGCLAACLVAAAVTSSLAAASDRRVGPS